MLKEIYEQPTAIRETIGTSLNLDKVDLPLDDIDFSQPKTEYENNKSWKNHFTKIVNPRFIFLERGVKFEPTNK